MKVKKTIYIPQTIEVEAQYVVTIRTGACDGMGSYSPAGEWHWFALCGDDKEFAEIKKEQAFHENTWVDVEIELLTDEEISKLSEW